MTTAAPDRSDPDVRALERFEHDRARDRAGRFGCAWVLIAAAAAAPFTVELTGDPGATVGAVVGALVLVALAAAVWPHDWSAAETEHHRLEAIWREIRTDADAHTPWERYGAWVESDGGGVALSLIVCAPVVKRVAGAPSRTRATSCSAWAPTTSPARPRRSMRSGLRRGTRAGGAREPRPRARRGRAARARGDAPPRRRRGGRVRARRRGAGAQRARRRGGRRKRGEGGGTRAGAAPAVIGSDAWRERGRAPQRSTSRSAS